MNFKQNHFFDKININAFQSIFCPKVARVKSNTHICASKDYHLYLMMKSQTVVLVDGRTDDRVITNSFRQMYTIASPTHDKSIKKYLYIHNIAKNITNLHKSHLGLLNIFKTIFMGSHPCTTCNYRLRARFGLWVAIDMSGA